LDQGQVRLGIAADHFGIVFPLVGQADLDLFGVFNHVVAGDDEALPIDDEPGAEAPLFELAARAALTEGVPVVEQAAVAKGAAEKVRRKTGPPSSWFTVRMFTTPGCASLARAEN
jgi:hypothetical protein